MSWCRSEWSSKDESEERSWEGEPVIALLQEGALMGTEEQKPNRKAGITTDALSPEFEFRRCQEYF